MQDINKNADVLKPFFEICNNFDFRFASPAVTQFVSEVRLVTNSLNMCCSMQILSLMNLLYTKLYTQH